MIEQFIARLIRVQTVRMFIIQYLLHYLTLFNWLEKIDTKKYFFIENRGYFQPIPRA